MKLKIVGSGGMFLIPNPFCKCSVCYDADVLIIGLVSDDGILKDGSKLDSAPFRDDMFTLDEITHIDEYWGKSYAYYREFEKKLDNVSFAYDGMEIVL